MKKRFLISLLLISLFMSSFCSCSGRSRHTAENFDCFDTYSSLTVYCGQSEFEIYKNEFESVINKYHKLFDIYNSYDGTVNIKDLNDRATLSPIEVSTELFDALTIAKELCTTTHGKCNIAIGALTSIWHDARDHSENDPKNAYIPTQTQIDEALLHTDINSIKLDPEARTVYFSDPKLSIDLGGIAKGYVASVLYKRLIDLGCDSFLIDLGGNIASHGVKERQEPWRILIENPFDNKKLGYNEPIGLYDETLVTSGSYQRYFIYNEKQYSHIIDTSSGYPADLFTSVSVLAPADSSALADALSTALFCMSYEEGLSLIKSINNVEALWIFNDGSVKHTEGFGGVK